VLALASAGGRLYDLRADTGQVELRDAATGGVRQAARSGAEVLTGGNEVWAAGCCALATPAQTVTKLDPSSLRVTSSVVVPEEGEIPQLAAGRAGVWLLSEDGALLREIDGRSRSVNLSSQPASVLVVGSTSVVLAGSDGTLAAIDPTTGRAGWRVPFAPDGGVRPTAVAIFGDEIYLAIPQHVLTFSISRRVKTADFSIDAQWFAVSTDGVWAATPSAAVELR
jgi:outer membrane protein assembly factor BamB